jgi:hypothetical protein
MSFKCTNNVKQQQQQKRYQTNKQTTNLITVYYQNKFIVLCSLKFIMGTLP